LFEDLLVQKHDGTQRLTLRRGSDMAFHSEMGEELLDFLPAHLARMPFAVKENEAPYPTQVGSLGP
jgi:hypothetical protein